MPPRLLVLSNGHGEDLIALRVIEALRRLQPSAKLSVLALVGEGAAFTAAREALGLACLGPCRPLPSGGFSNQSLSGLLRDIAAGLPVTTWQQLQVVRRWGATGQPILAVGDLLPLAMAWLGGGPYGFIGTPKSDFTWKTPSPPGWGSTALADRYHRWKGSEWDPWEWGLMGHRRCRLVAVRDRLTARGLQSHRVAALAPGNPMMDGFERRPLPLPWRRRRRVMLLPGSRLPEALGNLERLLASLPDPSQCDRLGGLTVLMPTGQGLFRSLEHAALFAAAGFRPQPPPPGSGARSGWQRGALEMWIGPGCFEAWAPWVEVGLATAGTATEQLVGLGLPALSLPGPGPQFTRGFAQRQSRLLGGAVLPCGHPEEMRAELLALLHDHTARQRLGRRGRRRMGPAGGSARLAALINERLWLPEPPAAPLGKDDAHCSSPSGDARDS
ncbi:MAG: lipid-A-disaccharide synthase-related protein [Cyanobacteriota bacterium]|nr:lipid-A-disaccharide synthase-related protein [Cyanobacteriota bacterium]